MYMGILFVLTYYVTRTLRQLPEWLIPSILILVNVINHKVNLARMENSENHREPVVFSIEASRLPINEFIVREKYSRIRPQNVRSNPTIHITDAIITVN